jgi:hypothetical protein
MINKFVLAAGRAREQARQLLQAAQWQFEVSKNNRHTHTSKPLKKKWGGDANFILLPIQFLFSFALGSNSF